MTNAGPETHAAQLDSYSPAQNDVGLQSARAVVPLIMSLTAPMSVIDVGCGPGNWLAAFRERGITDIFGVDQHDYGADLRIPHDRFQVVDLNKPFQSERKFDLVICVEVAEHLAPESAPILIESLARLGSVVVFSAAIPFQGGTDHRNEQWPDYWRRLFGTHEFVPLDCLRPRIWENREVAWWYSQNILLYVNEESLAANAGLRAEAEHLPMYPLALVHPSLYAKRMAANLPAPPTGFMRRALSALRRV